MKPTRKRGLKLRSDGGFTLIELMAVVVIIGILATIVSVAIMGRVAEARRTSTIAQIKNIEAALKMFKLNHGFYPSTEQGLEALISVPTTGRIPPKYPRGGYLDASEAPNDSWDSPFKYESPGSNGFDYEISSFGADGVSGGEEENEDIESWNIN